ncbi:unnamed protein product [Symbiodinium necroappetens]|uniref:Pentatricopeptide repeat-containing protein, chloroplastic n=1 Tax=Symbiodinium necroappetens TaxID=1628268 RepID=A0A812SK11_9DINO|nr:unnamed protein product [Symbiodinium necroappetens]
MGAFADQKELWEQVLALLDEVASCSLKKHGEALSRQLELGMHEHGVDLEGAPCLNGLGSRRVAEILKMGKMWNIQNSVHNTVVSTLGSCAACSNTMDAKREGPVPDLISPRAAHWSCFSAAMSATVAVYDRRADKGALTERGLWRDVLALLADMRSAQMSRSCKILESLDSSGWWVGLFMLAVENCSTWCKYMVQGWIDSIIRSRTLASAVPLSVPVARQGWELSLDILMAGRCLGQRLRVNGRAWRAAPDAICFNRSLAAAEEQWMLAIALLAGVLALPTRKSVRYNTALSAIEKGRAWERGIEQLLSMRRQGLVPDVVTWTAGDSSATCLQVSVERDPERSGPRCRTELLDAGASRFILASPIETKDWALAQAYMRDLQQIPLLVQVGAWELALEVLWEPGWCPGLIAFNAVAAACERGGRWEQTLQVLSAMRGQRLLPDALGFGAAVAAAAAAGAWAAALQLLEEMEDARHSPNMLVYEAALSAYLQGMQHRENPHIMGDDDADRCSTVVRTEDVIRDRLVPQINLLDFKESTLVLVLQFQQLYEDLTTWRAGPGNADSGCKVCEQSGRGLLAAKEISLESGFPGLGDFQNESMHALEFNDTPLDVVVKDFKKAESRTEKLKDKYDGAVECVDKVKDYKENIEDKIEEYRDKVNDHVRQNQQRLDGYHRKYNQFGTRHSIEDEIWEETLTDFDHDDDEISHKSKIAEEDWADRIASAIWLSKGMNAVRAGTALMQNLQALLNYNAEDGGPRELEEAINRFAKEFQKLSQPKDQEERNVKWQQLFKSGAPKALGDVFLAVIDAIAMDSDYFEAEQLMLQHYQDSERIFDIMKDREVPAGIPNHSTCGKTFAGTLREGP